MRVARCAKNAQVVGHDYGEEKTSDMIEIIWGLAWMDKSQTPDHLMWRDVRKTETLVNLTQRTHLRFFAQRVKRTLLRIKA